MKTAISLPDETFERVSVAAGELGVSRSEFFARAAVAYLDGLANSSLVAEINKALQRVGEDEDSDAVVEAGRQRLRDLNDDW